MRTGAFLTGALPDVLAGALDTDRLAAGRAPRVPDDRAGVLPPADPDFVPPREPVATVEAPPLLLRSVVRWVVPRVAM
ncbi:hypothetical protein AB1207_08425 [Kineococcus endophyticus]|uniref:Uncharacterized protein n=1 Tax=Kineococcus endophyticus TaxID=1181883 RepID=A0ABV3P563_9ACTN